MDSDQVSSRVNRRTFLGGAVALGAWGFIAGCQPPRGGQPTQPGREIAPSDKPPGWDALVEAARREGEVSLYLAVPAARDVLTTPFETAYPGMRVSQIIAPNIDLVARIVAEREARKNLADVIIGPASQAVLVLKPAGAVEPLAPLLVLPEVIDASKWLDNRLWWIDAREPATTLSFQGYVAASVSYNTQMVDPKELTSLLDLLNPKWRGKIVSNDIRRPGSGATQIRTIWRDPELGPGFLERLFSEQDIQIGSDHRQMIDWLAQGRYPLGLWLSSSQLKAAADDGLPVNDLSAKNFREAPGVTQGGGTVNIAANAPHPNAAKLFINWFLSREGQILWQRELGTPSLRIDIPKDDLDPGIVPEPGVSYIDTTTEAFQSTVSSDEIRDTIDRALARRS